MFHGWSSFRKFSKKNFQIPENDQNRSQKYPNVFWGDFFEKNFAPSVPWMVEFSKNFKKKFQIPENDQKRSQKYPNVFGTYFGETFLKNFMPSVPWRVEFSKIFNFFFSKFRKCPKSLPKASKRVLNVFWGKLFEKF